MKFHSNFGFIILKLFDRQHDKKIVKVALEGTA